MLDKTKICIVGVYFGKFPKYFNLWLRSCAENPDVNFLIVTDNKLSKLPQNISCVNMRLEEFKELADEKLGFETSLTTPYKCCDFKAVYGIILGDFLKDYEFWGHCDFDMIFGNIRTFITEEILEKYDKILYMGHLSLYRNTEECNNRYKADGSLVGNYKEVYTKPQNVAFDEMRGMYQIYLNNKIPVYDKRIFADIATSYKRFKLIDECVNYKYQAFYWESGRIYRVGYIKNKKAEKDEFMYIHFQKRGFNTTLESDQGAFYICPTGFVSKECTGDPSIEDIKKVNPYNVVQEFCGKVRKMWNFNIRPRIFRISAKIRRNFTKK